MPGKEASLLEVWSFRGVCDGLQIISTAAEGKDAGMALQHSTPAKRVNANAVDLCLNLAQHTYRLYRQLTSGKELSCSLTAAAHVLCHTARG